jgi:hypothetical protein
MDRERENPQIKQMNTDFQLAQRAAEGAEGETLNHETDETREIENHGETLIIAN